MIDQFGIILMTESNAKIITLLISFLMLMCFFSPRKLVALYFFFRPLIQPYADMKYTLYGNMPISAILSIIVIFAALLNTLLKFRNNIKFPLEISAIYLIVFFSMFSFLNASNILLSVGGEIKILTSISIYTLVYLSISHIDDVKKIFIVYFLCSVLPMSFGYYQYITGSSLALGEIKTSGHRIASFLGQYNAYGEYLSAVIIAGVASYSVEFKTTEKFFRILIMISALVSQILALNRGTWICMMIGFIVASIIYFNKIKIWRLFCIVLIIFVVFGGVMIKRFDELNQVSESGNSQNTLQDRTNRWKIVSEMVIDHPFIGHGIESAQYILNDIEITLMPHNDYLKIAYELGIPAALLYIFFYLNELVKILRRSFGSSLWQMNYASIIMVVYLSIISFFQNIFSGIIIFPMFMALFAISHRFNNLEISVKAVNDNNK